MNAQSNPETHLPYERIPDYPARFTNGTIIARMIDGLGFRYYWATEGLLDENLTYRPTAEHRSLRELLQHVHALSGVILNSARKLPNNRTKKTPEVQNLVALREQTLNNLEAASRLFAASEDLASHNVVFIGTAGNTEYPFWNQINGALEDAVWHSGQIATLRRACGNPMNPGVNPFLGVTKK